MHWSNKKVFVSGGAGVIGTYLVEQLIQEGADIFVGDLKPKPEKWNNIHYRQGDLNTITPEELLAFNPEVFFHLAATFERSLETPEFWKENFLHNVHLSHYLLNILKESSSLKKVIFASSYLVYDPKLYLFPNPSKKGIFLSEHSLLNPRNLCGMAKLYHEKELAFTQEFHPHLSLSNARIFRSYGKNSRDILSRWVRMLLKNEEITTYAPEGLFDFVYAGDVADGLLKLAEIPVSGTFNLGSGHARSIQEALNILKTHFPNMQVQHGLSQIPYEASQADMTAFTQATGWHPSTTLEQGLAYLIAHEKQLLKSS